MKPFRFRQITVTAGLAALSASAQLFHLGYQVPQWGMWLDVVAVPWLIAYFLFGLAPALAVAVLGGLIITLFSPDTWIGASMKLAATLPLILLIPLYLKIIKKQPLHCFSPLLLLPPVALGLAARAGLVLPLNYYWAIPLWTGLTVDQAFGLIPWYIIAGLNLVQGLIDIILAWLLVYKLRLYRYADWTR